MPSVVLRLARYFDLTCGIFNSLEMFDSYECLNVKQTISLQMLHDNTSLHSVQEENTAGVTTSMDMSNTSYLIYFTMFLFNYFKVT